MQAIKAWIYAFRLRTLPLAFSSIGMGSFLAASDASFKWDIFALSMLTTLFLQILSNLANDYGDFFNGADSPFRKGPVRAVQAGMISPGAMRRGIIIFGLLALSSGVILLFKAISVSAFGTFGFFLLLGMLAIYSAIKYTAGRSPYGYSGFGDLSVFLFFGLTGVLGTYYLHVLDLRPGLLLPAFSCGFFSVAVLNINNIRDIEADTIAGKKSIPVRIGGRLAIIYHWLLLLGGVLSAAFYVYLRIGSYWQWIFLLALPFIFLNAIHVSKANDPAALNPLLKQMSLTTLLFVLLFGAGQLLG